MCALSLKHPFIGAVIFAALAGPSVPSATADLAGEVNPFVGTEAGQPDYGNGGGGGNTFPGASAPFGMVQFSPNTTPNLKSFNGGYGYRDRRINGFSLKQFSGAGCAAYRDVSLMPVNSAPDRSPVGPGMTTIKPEFYSEFSHSHEQAAPGDYRVTLGPNGSNPIKTELTATTRTGAMRLQYQTGGGALLINAGGSVKGTRTAAVRIDPSRREITVELESGGLCYDRNRYRLYAVLRFSQPLQRFGTFSGDRLRHGAVSAADRIPVRPFVLTDGQNFLPNMQANRGITARAGAYVQFAERDVEVRAGLSFVDLEGARHNLAVESDGRSFTALRDQTRSVWNDLLSRAEPQGGEPDLRSGFVTAMYHSLLLPPTFSDADGRYRGFDNAVHTATGFTKYADISTWDAYQTHMPLLALLFPERAQDIARSVVLDAEQGGALGKFTMANDYVNVMNGDPAAMVLSSIHAFGAQGFPAQDALRLMVDGATKPGRTPNGQYEERPGLAEALQLGYVPSELETERFATTSRRGVWGSAATTLQYATADHAIARMASRLGDAKTCQTFTGRASWWKNLWNPRTGFLQPRRRSGVFGYAGLLAPLPLDPRLSLGYAEGNAYHYLWTVPQDIEGLVAKIGGVQKARARLDAHLGRLNGGPDSRYAYLGNEVSSPTPWLYAWLGAPERTQEMVRRTQLELFPNTPDGIPGNDDAGSMSSWYVWASLGLYPATPGTDTLVLGSPLLPKVTLRPPGKSITISAPLAAAGRPYVNGLKVNGTPYNQGWLRASDLAHDSNLDWDLGTRPTTWAHGSTPPPSYGPNAPC